MRKMVKFTIVSAKTDFHIHAEHTAVEILIRNVIRKIYSGLKNQKNNASSSGFQVK